MSTKYTNTTKALHVGHNPENTAGTRSVPIYNSVAYVFKDTDHAERLFNLKEFGYIYSRLNNPTNTILEDRVAALENGIGAVSFASGMSAISSTLLTLLKSGDHILASNSLYGGTFNLIDVTLRRFGIETTFFDPDNLKELEKKKQKNTKLIFAETLSNPKLDIIDLEAVSAIAKRNNLLFVVDNTIATPSLLNPIDFGANIVIHSLTKYISGQGTALGGIVVDGGNFDWGNGTFPEFIEPSAGYHGLKYYETFKELAFLVKLRIEGLRDFGAALSPNSAYQIIQGLETLDLRIKQHSKNALELAKWLNKQELVEWVNYPGLENNRYFNKAKKYLPNGQSGVVTLGLKGGFESAKKFTDSVQLFSLLANIGDTKSLIIHPASTSHQQLPEEKQRKAGVTPALIRLSIGLEDVENLKEDIVQALSKVEEKCLQNV